MEGLRYRHQRFILQRPMGPFIHFCAMQSFAHPPICQKFDAITFLLRCSSTVECTPLLKGCGFETCRMLGLALPGSHKLILSSVVRKQVSCRGEKLFFKRCLTEELWADLT